MANVFWLGGQTTVRARRTFTIGYSALQTITMTVNGKNFAYTATSSDTDAAAVAVGLANAGVNSKESNHSECTFSSNGSTLIIDGPDDGGPLTASGAASAGSVTSVQNTAGVSPNDVGDMANYSTGALPNNNDTVTAPKGAPAWRYRLDALNGLTNLNFVREAGGPLLGVPDVRDDGRREWRATRVKIKANTVTLTLDGSEPYQSIRFDFGNTATIVEAVGTDGGGIDAEVCDFSGLAAGCEVRIRSLSAVLGLNRDYIAAPDTVSLLDAANCSVQVGPYATGTALRLNGGSADVGCTFTTLTMDQGAAVEVSGNGTGQPIVDGGQLAWTSTANILNPIFGSGGAVNFDGGAGGLAVTGVVTITGDDVVFTDTTGRLTRPYSIVYSRTAPDSDALNLGSNFKLTIANV